MENYLNLEQSKAIRSLRYKYFTFKVKSQPEYYWVNMSAYKREYELMEAELAEYVSDGCTWAEFDDTYPAFRIDQLPDTNPAWSPEDIELLNAIKEKRLTNINFSNSRHIVSFQTLSQTEA